MPNCSECAYCITYFDDLSCCSHSKCIYDSIVGKVIVSLPTIHEGGIKVTGSSRCREHLQSMDSSPDWCPLRRKE